MAAQARWTTPGQSMSVKVMMVGMTVPNRQMQMVLSNIRTPIAAARFSQVSQLHIGRHLDQLLLR